MVDLGGGKWRYFRSRFSRVGFFLIVSEEVLAEMRFG